MFTSNNGHNKRNENESNADAQVSRSGDSAHTLHGGDTRKQTSIPYIAHLFGVCGLVLTDGGDEDEAISALLHDVLEDHPERIDRATLEQRFGPRVKALVEICTDTPSDYAGGEKPDWAKRKRNYLAHLATCKPDDLRVPIADKLDNARAILSDYRAIGDQLWSRFKEPKEKQLWYYRAVTAFKAAGVRSGILADLGRTVTEIDHLAAHASVVARAFV